MKPIYFDIGNPLRRTISSKNEFLKFVKENNGIKNCYKSVYKFEQLNPEYNYPRARYETAFIDRIYFDFDNTEKQIINGESVEKPIDAFSNMLQTHELLLENDFQHYADFTGNGYAIFVLTDKQQPINKKSAIKGFQQKYGIGTDTSSFGDIARIHRIIFTKNLNGGKIAIPLNQEYLDKGDKFIREVNDYKNAKREIFGKNLISLEEYDWPEEESVIEETNFIEMDFELEDMEYVPKCVQTALIVKNPSFNLRQLFYAYFVEIGLNEENIINMIKDIWNPKKLKHSLFDEKQLQTIIKKQLRVPVRETIIKWNLCHNCKKCII